MKYISEEKLREMVYTDDYCNDLINADEALSACTELNPNEREGHPWQPIDENTPKDRELLGYRKDTHNKFIFDWCITHFRWEDDCGMEVYPTHWQELPPDPI